MSEELADFGLIGLAVMGENLALNVESRGYKMAVYNRSTEKVDNLINGRAAGKISRTPCLGLFSSPELRRDRHPARHQPKPCGHFVASREATAPTLPATTCKHKDINRRC